MFGRGRGEAVVVLQARSKTSSEVAKELHRPLSTRSLSHARGVEQICSVAPEARARGPHEVKESSSKPSWSSKHLPNFTLVLSDVYCSGSGLSFGATAGAPMQIRFVLGQDGSRL